jgi:8-oxo-dGTP pyrophosphatase MutT (NUDIX family)
VGEQEASTAAVDAHDLRFWFEHPSILADGDTVASMAADELIDAFDDDLRPLGPMRRDAVHAAGLWHGVFHCLIVRGDPPARVLLQRRPAGARSFPGLLDLSVTGHLQRGETAAAGVREIEEELGLVARPEDLVPLGRRLLVDPEGEGRNREIVHAFLLRLDAPLEEIDISAGDVDGLVEMEADALMRLLDGHSSVSARERDRSGAVGAVRVRRADLVPQLDGYWTTFAIMAERFARGVRPLSI